MGSFLDQIAYRTRVDAIDAIDAVQTIPARVTGWTPSAPESDEPTVTTEYEYGVEDVFDGCLI